MGAHETTSSGDLLAPEGRRQDVLAILTLTATVLLTLALISYDARNGSANLVGPVGHRLARALVLAFGLVSALLHARERGSRPLQRRGRRVGPLRPPSPPRVSVRAVAIEYCCVYDTRAARRLP